VSEWRRSCDIEHAILPIADILPVSIKNLCSLRFASFRRSELMPPLPNLMRLPLPSLFGIEALSDLQASIGDSVSAIESEDLLLPDD
jgi:hypothetical protein